jgi:poly(3-hydroxybutyrate) depolymerase
MIRLADIPPDHPGRRLLTGHTPFFAAPTEPRCSYCLYVPNCDDWDAKLPVLVVVHGTERGAERARDALAGFAEEHGAIIVAPLFPAGINDPDDLDNYKFLEYQDIRFDLVLLDILDHIRERWNSDTERFVLCGHSGGGQFAHRFFYLHPDRLSAVAISAPGRVTLIDDTRDWWAGTRDTRSVFGIDVDATRLAEVPVLLTIGSDDDGAVELAAVDDGGSRQAGRTRHERLENLHRNLQAHGVTVTRVDIDGAGHEGMPTLPAITTFAAAHLHSGKTSSRWSPRADERTGRGP